MAFGICLDYHLAGRYSASFPDSLHRDIYLGFLPIEAVHTADDCHVKWGNRQGHFLPSHMGRRAGDAGVRLAGAV